MKSLVRFVLDEQGKMTREDVTIRDVRITPAVAASLCEDISLRIPKVARHSRWGDISVCVTKDQIFWWTVDLPLLNIRCPFKVVEGVAVPQLDSETDPLMELKWTPPKTMRLEFLTATYMHNPRTAAKYESAYIFAYSNDGNTWRLPLGNLYDECRICMGEEEFRASTHLACLEKILVQFENSEWNADLWSSSKRVKTQQLFRFEPKNEGFVQMPVNENGWTAMCDKVSVALSSYVILTERTL